MEVKAHSCVLCGSQAFRVRYKFDHFYIPSMGEWLREDLPDVPPEAFLIECCHCRLLSLYPLPTRDLIEKIHNDPHYGFDRGDEVGSMRYAADVMETVHKVRRRAGRLLDIGCAKGMFLAVARHHGWEGIGVDFNPDAVSYARDVFGVHAMVGNAEDMAFGDDRFDLITMWDVIEHLPEPLRFLSKLKNLLKPDGLLAFETPNAASLYARLRRKYWGYGPHHLYYYSPDTIKCLLDKAGLRIHLLETPNFNVLSREGLFRSGLTRDMWVNSLGQRLRVFLYQHRKQPDIRHLLHLRQRRKKIPEHSFQRRVDPAARRRVLEAELGSYAQRRSVLKTANAPLNALAQRWSLGDQLRVVCGPV